MTSRQIICIIQRYHLGQSVDNCGFAFLNEPLFVLLRTYACIGNNDHYYIKKIACHLDRMQ